MAPQRLEPELLDHLRVEFGQHGDRAAELLLDAHAQLVSRGPMCRLQESVAHCLREAMKSILASVESGEAGGWRRLSRQVVDARRRYGMAVGLPGQDEKRALSDLLASIDGLNRFHKEEHGLHERRLISVMVSRTGTAPLSAGASPVRDYQELLNRLDTAAHGGETQESIEELWAECAAILRLLFLPPEIRHEELERLAQTAHPTRVDTQAVTDLVSSPRHLQHFLGTIESHAWLEALGAAGVLDPTDTDGPWPPHAAVVRLTERYPVEVTGWLEDMYRLHGATPALAAQIGYTSRAAGGLALSLVLAAVKDNPEHHGIVMTGVRAAEQADACDSLVEDLADVILNPNSWAAAHFVNPLLDQMSAGINEENSQRRIDILVYKIRSLPRDDRLLRRLRWQPYGSIAETPRSAQDDRSRLLLSCLLHLLESAWAWTAASDLLDALDRLPDSSLRQRLRAWILANAPDADSRLITDEIEQAISSRMPTGDDVALLDRAATDCDSSIYAPKWRKALGTAPDVEQVEPALAADDVHEDWLRALQWVPLLPDDAAGAWVTVCDILATRYGRSNREGLTRHQPDIAQYAVSPITAEQLRSLDPDIAAATVASWRPGPTDWLGGVREIARTLEYVVRDNMALRVYVGLRVAGTGWGHYVTRMPRASKLVGLVNPWAVRRRTWSRLLVPSILPLEARSVWCQARISSDQAMMVSTMSWNSGSSPVS